MAFSHSIRELWQRGEDSILVDNTQTSTAESNVSEAIATGADDLLVNFTLDVDKCVSFFMLSDQAMTVETNDGGSPVNTIVLVANIPYVWYTGCYHPFLLTTDVTALYITQDSGETANLEIRALHDPTPA